MDSENIEFTLGIQNLKNIQFDTYQKDFVFIVNGKRHATSRFVADLLSPIVRKLHHTDPTQNEFCIETSQHSKEDHFEEFLQFVNFEPRLIESSQIQIISEYFYKLGNIDEYVTFLRLNIKEYNCDNIFEQLQSISAIITKENHSEKVTQLFQEAVDFVSENFEDLDKEKMKKLDSFVLDSILSNPKLRVNNEETVLNFVLNKYEEDQHQSNLIEYVLVQNLSLEGLHNFVDKIEFSDINIKTWSNICKRLFKEEQTKQEENERYKKQVQNKEESNVKTFESSNEGQDTFDGIMRYLTKQTGGNIHNNGTIEITSNSINTNGQIPQNSVDFDNYQSNYCSKNLRDSNICFDFKNRRVQLAKYAIKSRTDGSQNFTNLKNWVIESSNDNANWIELDRRENDSSLNGKGNINSFIIQRPQPTFYRFIRLRQTGESWFNRSSHFGFTYIEFYGKLQEP